MREGSLVMASASESLRGLVLSADEVRRMTGWTDDQIIEDYLNIIRNFAEIAEIVDDNEQNTITIQTEIIAGSANNYASIGKIRSMLSKLERRVNSNKGLIHAW